MYIEEENEHSKQIAASFDNVYICVGVTISIFTYRNDGVRSNLV